MNNKSINAISLFSSAGIGELYLHDRINFKVANELIPKRANCYEFFYPGTKMITGDITKKIIQNKIINYSKNRDINFILATPPCQGLSTMGKNKVQSDFIKDKRNFLVLQALKIIDNIKPNYILIENVPRFLNMYFPYRGELRLLKDILKIKYSKHYSININILNAMYYGVGQSRPRAIIRMYKKGLTWPLPKRESPIPLRKSIGYLPSLKPGEKSNIKWHYAKKIRSGLILALKHTPTGCSALKNKIYYPKKVNGQRIKGFHNAYSRMRWDKPAPARTTYSGSVSSQNNVHPGRKLKDGTYSDPRVLSMLETFIVSSIPKDIKFPKDSSDTFIRTMIGEAIPPKMLYHICFPRKDQIL